MYSSQSTLPLLSRLIFSASCITADVLIYIFPSLFTHMLMLSCTLFALNISSFGTPENILRTDINTNVSNMLCMEDPPLV